MKVELRERRLHKRSAVRKPLRCIQRLSPEQRSRHRVFNKDDDLRHAADTDAHARNLARQVSSIGRYC